MRLNECETDGIPAPSDEELRALDQAVNRQVLDNLMKRVGGIPNWDSEFDARQRSREMASLIIAGDPWSIDDLSSELDNRNYLSGFKTAIVNVDITRIEHVLSAFWKLHMHYLREIEAGLQCDWCQADGSS